MYNFSYPQMNGSNYPNSYMNNYQNQPRFTPQAPQIPQPGNTNIIWVQGIEGAKALQLPPNYTAILFDSQSQDHGYIKTVDSLGRSTTQIFTYKEEKEKREEDASVKPDYVTRQQVLSMIKEYNNEQPVQTNESTRKPIIIKHD